MGAGRAGGREGSSSESRRNKLGALKALSPRFTLPLRQRLSPLRIVA